MGSSSKNPGLWVIRHKVTKNHVRVPSGKTSWAQPGHAKNAWWGWGGRPLILMKRFAENLGVELVPTGYKGALQFPKFDEQDVYELVDISQEGKDLTRNIVEFLMQIQGRLADLSLEDKATELLKELNSDGSKGEA